MTSAFDPSRLPDSVRPHVVRALREGEDLDRAIEALEGYLAEGGERTPDVLLALATLTYEDAATLVLNRLATASEQAIALLDEVLERTPDDSELVALRARFAEALAGERAREKRLRELLVRPEGARPSEIMELAHRILLSGDDDGLATALMAELAES